MRKSEHSKEKKVSLRVDCEGELADEATRLKNLRGLKNYSELVRQLIVEAFQRETAKQPVEVPAQQ